MKKRLMRYSRVLLMLTCIVTLSCNRAMTAFSSKAASKTTTVRRVETAGMEVDILRLINEYRASLGKSPLKMVQVASAQAQVHSQDMADRKMPFGHDGFSQRASAISQSEGRISAAAENVAYGQLSAREVVDGWLHSPPHRRNIEGDYAFTGIGLAQNNDGTIYYTQIFFRK